MKIFRDKWVKSLKAKEHAYDVTESDGFTIRVQKSPSKTKTFYYVFKVNGKRERIKIGEYGPLTLAEAREKSTALHNARKRGEDIKPKKEVVETVNDLATRYLEKYSKPKNTERVYKENKRNLDRDILPYIGTLSLAEIKRKDVHTILQKIIDRKAPVQSNNALKVMRKMFNYAIQSGVMENNPAHLIEKQPEKEKTRVLSDKEIKKAWHGIAQGKVSAETINCLRLILVTAQRPGEVLNMEHEEIDGHWWTIPIEKTKNKNVEHATDHRVYLSGLAKELIGEAHGRVHRKPARTEALGNALRRLFNSERLKMTKFTPHDLRRTAATNIAELGHDESKVLGHMPGKIKRTYNRYLYDPEKQAAMLAWEKKLLRLLE